MIRNLSFMSRALLTETIARSAGVFCMLCVLCILGAPAGASAWEPFVSSNRNVDEGNTAMSEGDHAGALEAYDRAARELPEAPGVQLNRGLALMGQERLDEAREALLRASEPGGRDDVRADAFYDLGLAFYRQGDAAATGDDHEGAQRQFREAADAFRRSLRARPGNRDAAWNLELALRRIQEEEQAQEEQEEQEQDDQEEQEEQDEGDEENDEEQQDGDQEEQDDQEEQQDGEEGNDEEQQNSDQEEPEDGEGEQDDSQDQEGDDQEESQPEDGQGEDAPPEPQDGDQENESQTDEDGSGGQELPRDVSRVLDALRDSEESLERQRARARGQRENRRVTMDW